MTKAECLARAAEFRAHADREIQNIAVYAVAFGGADETTKAAVRMRADDLKEAQKWETLAKMHPSTRSMVIRSWTVSP